jgi:hypothetical protein
VAAARLMTRHRVMQELRHSGSFSSGVLPPVLTQRPEVPKAEVLEEWRIVVGLKRTRVSGLSTPGKREKGRMNESLRIEISEVWRHEGDLDH